MAQLADASVDAVITDPPYLAMGGRRVLTGGTRGLFGGQPGVPLHPCYRPHSGRGVE